MKNVENENQKFCNRITLDVNVFNPTKSRGGEVGQVVEDIYGRWNRDKLIGMAVASRRIKNGTTGTGRARNR